VSNSAFSIAGVTKDYVRLSEDERIAVLTRELSNSRPLSSIHVAYSDRTSSELSIVRTVADIQSRFGKKSVPNYVISNCQSLSDLLEVAVLLKEAGLLHFQGGEGGQDGAAPSSVLRMRIIPLFETIDDLRRGAAVMDAAFKHPLYSTWLTEGSGEHAGRVQEVRQLQLSLSRSFLPLHLVLSFIASFLFFRSCWGIQTRVKTVAC
jgi:phosphoenolpyruvate carboxylase